MKEFPPETKFRYTWRPYQARVLSELEEYLGDNRLHVVAAPGSGKTLLGLEVVRRKKKERRVKFSVMWKVAQEENERHILVHSGKYWVQSDLLDTFF